MPGFDNRKFERILGDAEISYRVVAHNQTQGTLSKDISEGGIRFFCNDFIPLGTKLRLRVLIRAIPYSFQALGETRWIKEASGGTRYEIGVEFTDIPNEAIQRLKALADSQPDEEAA